MCPSVTKENKGENQRIINQSFHDVTRCVSFYVSKKKEKTTSERKKENYTKKERRKAGRESEMRANQREMENKSIFLPEFE